MDGCCKTKYPVVLIHGTGFRDLAWPVYWGRIPKALAERDTALHYGLQDSWGSIETNAEAIAQRIQEIRAETGCEKVNLIAHSKGGLDARMAASSLGMGQHIASITTVATPHHGSKTVDRLLLAPRSLFNMAAFAVDNWIRLVGDKHPDFIAVCEGFSTARMAQFNAANPDCPGVFYQSYACAMRGPLSDVFLWIAEPILRRIEGENDGLVAVESARWGERFTVLRPAGRRGISHLDAIDFRRAPLARRGEGVRDIVDVYVAIVADLKCRGL